jgi:hypothetical protein
MRWHRCKIPQKTKQMYWIMQNDMSLNLNFKSTFTASARCPSQRLCSHVVYSSTYDPSQPQGSPPCTGSRPKLGGVLITDVAVGSQTLAHASYCPGCPACFPSTSLYSSLLSHPALHLFSCCFLLLSGAVTYSAAHFRLSYYFVFGLISCIASSRECDMSLPASDVD